MRGGGPSGKVVLLIEEVVDSCEGLSEEGLSKEKVWQRKKEIG